MALKDLFREFLGTIRGRAMKDVALDDLQRERNRLRGVEDDLRSEQGELELRERQLLEEGREATGVAVKKALAGKIRDVRESSRALEQRAAFLGKSLRIVSGLITIKENEAFYANAGMGGVLSGMPLEKIIVDIESAPAGMEQNLDAMQEILESLGGAVSAIDKALGAVAGDDAELDDIMREFDAAPGANTAPAGERSERSGEGPLSGAEPEKTDSL